MAINDIKAAGNAVYILNNTDLYAMDNYSSTAGLTLVLKDVKYIDASPKGCVAIKTDDTVWYSGDSIDSLNGDIIKQFQDVSSKFSTIDQFNIKTAKIKKSFYGCMVLVPETKSLWAIGHNKYGELGTGLGSYNKFFDTFVKNEAHDVEDFFLGANCSFYKDSTGTIYGAGYNSGVIKASTTYNISYYKEVQWKSDETYFSSGGLIYKDSDKYYALGNQSYGQLSTNYDSIIDYCLIYPTEITLEKNLKFSDLTKVDNNIFDNAIVAYGNNKFYSSGKVLNQNIPYISTIDLGSSLVPDIIAFNNNSILIAVKDDVYYCGLIDEGYKKEWTKIDFTNRTPFVVYDVIGTPNTLILNAVNSDTNVNTLRNPAEDKFVIYKNDYVYFCSNTLDDSSSLKVLYDETVWYYGKGTIIGSSKDVTEWTECTELFHSKNEIRDNILECKFLLTRGGVLVLTPLGNIYAIGNSYNCDLGLPIEVPAGKTDNVTVYSKLVKTSARNAIRMGSNYEFTFYLNSANEMFYSGNTSGMEALTPSEEDHSEVIDPDSAVAPHGTLPVFITNGFTKVTWWNTKLVYKSSRTNNFMVQKGDDLWGYGWDWRYTLGLTNGAKNLNKKISLPDSLTANDIQLFADENSASTDFAFFMSKAGNFYIAGTILFGPGGSSYYRTFTKMTDLKLPQGIKPEDVVRLGSSNEVIIMCTNSKDVYYTGKQCDIIDPTSTAENTGWNKVTFNYKG